MLYCESIKTPVINHNLAQSPSWNESWNVSLERRRGVRASRCHLVVVSCHYNHLHMSGTSIDKYIVSHDWVSEQRRHRIHNLKTFIYITWITSADKNHEPGHSADLGSALRSGSRVFEVLLLQYFSEGSFLILPPLQGQRSGWDCPGNGATTALSPINVTIFHIFWSRCKEETILLACDQIRFIGYFRP